MGFQYRTSQQKVYVRKKSLDIVCRRIGALRALWHHREEGRQVVYVDETWFTTWMGHNKEWVDTTQANTSAFYSHHVPHGEGEHFMVVAAGTDNGFVEGSYFCYPAKSNQGDYHGEMNSELFHQWLTTQLLPSLPEPSVLVRDNAPYHSTLTKDSRCPTSATKRENLIKWLEHRRIPIPAGATRPEILLICQKNRLKPCYKVDNIIREWGHEVVRLPPGHPELNAIGQGMKRHVRSPLQRFTRADLQAKLQESRLCTNPEVWTGVILQSQRFEEEYWTLDNNHESLEPVIINIATDDEDEDEELFLDNEGE
ncbi:uncharacterized protein [Macrobrachium rosenbergii]|uniref:uncharacterized protein n=1 Tax=Macrobrachium rosenbergii TaxID=79674 RepID=UPI0034D5DD64